MSEEAIKQNKSLHDENKRIYNTVHDQAKQNKQLLESTEKRIGEKVELILTNIELAVEANNSRLSAVSYTHLLWFTQYS